MSCDHNQSDEHLREQIEATIEKSGCYVVLIEADSYLPAFAYSIGLFEKFGHPEIICFGLPVNFCASIINNACEQIQQGEKFRPTVLYPGFVEGYHIQLLSVDKDYYQNYVGYGRWYYGEKEFPLLQIVWPDKAGKFPWEEGFNTKWQFKQPLLDRNTDFKFREERNLAVFTTKQALNGDPILYVYHNDDGEWQFHTSDSPNIADGIIVCLESITQLDPSINQIYHLPYGYRAWRANKDEHWEWEEDAGEEEEEIKSH